MSRGTFVISNTSKSFQTRLLPNWHAHMPSRNGAQAPITTTTKLVIKASAASETPQPPLKPPGS
jgi:hypothetical protein